MRIKTQGMTLLEVVVALIITGIIGVGFSQIAFFSAQNYQYSQSTSIVTAQANFIEAKLTRAIKNSVPNSFQISQSTNYICLETTPLLFRGLLNLNGQSNFIQVALPKREQVSSNPLHQDLEKYFILSTQAQHHSHQKTKILKLNADNLELMNPIDIDTASENQAFYIALNPVAFCIIPSKTSKTVDQLVYCNHKAVATNFKQCTIVGTQIVNSEGKSFFQSQSVPFVNIDKQDYQSNQIRFELGLRYEPFGVPSTYVFGNQITLDNH